MNLPEDIILLVEDDHDQAEEIIEIIQQLKKYQVLWAKNGREALQILSKNKKLLGFAGSKIKCILLDMMMPEMNGMQFIEQLRKDEKKRIIPNSIPVVFLTAYEDEEKWYSAIKNKAAGYLRKPFRKNDLEKILENIFEEWDHETLIEVTKTKGFEKLKDGSF